MLLGFTNSLVTACDFYIVMREVNERMTQGKNEIVTLSDALSRSQRPIVHRVRGTVDGCATYRSLLRFRRHIGRSRRLCCWSHLQHWLVRFTITHVNSFDAFFHVIFLFIIQDHVALTVSSNHTPGKLYYIIHQLVWFPKKRNFIWFLYATQSNAGKE